MALFMNNVKTIQSNYFQTVPFNGVNNSFEPWKVPVLKKHDL